jgi:hypothetical protein
MPTPGTTTPNKTGMTQEDFATEVSKLRPGILYWLRCQWPRLSENDYEDIFQSAVLRCLKGERYRRFNPDPDRMLGAFWTWFVWNPVPAKSRPRGQPSNRVATTIGGAYGGSGRPSAPTGHGLRRPRVPAWSIRRRKAGLLTLILPSPIRLSRTR